MNPLIQLKTTAPLLIALALLGFALSPTAQAVVPAPDGGYPGGNTAEGQNALFSLNVNTGTNNTAVGWFSLRSNVGGQYNTAVGSGTLFNNTASRNTAVGGAAMFGNTGGSFNTAVGMLSLFHSTGSFNTAIGDGALVTNSTGNGNTALGNNAGHSLTTGSGNVCIGAGVAGVADESNTTRIKNVYSSVASGRAVYVNSDNKIGTLASSRRFKDEIRPMDKVSEAILALKPVTFRYKKEIERNGAIMFGLIAEEVERVDPDLVTRNDKGQAETVRYDAVNAMLLNEFLKEHRRVEELKSTVATKLATMADLKSTVAQQQQEIQALAATVKEQTAHIQKVSAQLEASKPAPQVAENNR